MKSKSKVTSWQATGLGGPRPGPWPSETLAQPVGVAELGQRVMTSVMGCSY